VFEDIIPFEFWLCGVSSWILVARYFEMYTVLCRFISFTMHHMTDDTCGIIDAVMSNITWGVTGNRLRLDLRTALKLGFILNYLVVYGSI
jgi:hypothetical protein